MSVFPLSDIITDEIVTGKRFMRAGNPVVWGATVATRPAANTVEIGTSFIAIDGGQFNASVSDGTNWVVV